ncbi:MAG: c-di-GMP-binding flagellar brake protein YcgR [Candidatus Endobugula sp.]|jgi:c-di-GMP-binding flagellar brake protein YcgR
MTEEIKKESLRKSLRVKVNWSSRVLTPDRRILAARTKDVSEGGLGFELQEGLAVGAECNIELTPWSKGKQYLIRAKCIVTYSMLMASNAGFSHGVRFSFVPPDQLADLKKIIKEIIDK